MVLTFTIATASVLGLAITGFYPGMIVLLLLTLIPVTTKFFVKKIPGKSTAFRGNYYLICTLINLLVLLVVVWMTMVILVDRVFSKLL